MFRSSLSWVFISTRNGDVGVQNHPTMPWDTAGKEALKMTLKRPKVHSLLSVSGVWPNVMYKCQLCDYETVRWALVMCFSQIISLYEGCSLQNEGMGCYCKLLSGLVVLRHRVCCVSSVAETSLSCSAPFSSECGRLLNVVVWACFLIPCLPKNERTGWCACVCLQTKAKLALLVLGFLIGLHQDEFEKYVRNKECRLCLEILAKRWIKNVHSLAVPAVGVGTFLEEHPTKLREGSRSSHSLSVVIYCLCSPSGGTGVPQGRACVW